MANVSLSCKCGKVKGTATDVNASSGTRVVCCCSDCQAFAQHLGCDDTLDEFGGTEIFQVSQSQVSIQQGHNKLQSLRLAKKGLLRWYTSCCNTPVGNTTNAKMPYVGLIHTFLDEPDRDGVLGPVRAYIQTQYAKGEPGYPTHAAKFPIRITARIIRNMLIWKLKGMSKPSVFFGDDGRSVVKPIIANESSAERPQ